MRRPSVIKQQRGAAVRRRADLVPRSVPKRSELPTRLPKAVPAAAPVAAISMGHYLDYARTLTPDGGVRITYRDIDTRWRWHAWRVLVFSLATGFDAWLASTQSPVAGIVLNTVCWLIAASLNLFIVLAAIKTHRQIEIRPDCLILENREVFWRQHLEGGWPELREKDKTTFIFGGIYGTRFVEFGTLRRFDDNDRMPETFAAHVQQAIEQLWNIG